MAREISPAIEAFLIELEDQSNRQDWQPGTCTVVVNETIPSAESENLLERARMAAQFLEDILQGKVRDRLVIFPPRS